MFTLDHFAWKEAKERLSSGRRRRIDAELIDPGKIIDFESARRALEGYRSAESPGKQFNRSLLSVSG